MEGINVLSLFDGMSCGQIALERAGIKVKNYFASEIDKYAIKVTQKNYPSTIQLGSVTDVCFHDGYLIWNSGKNDLYVGQIDLILAGSPCQGFSFAGKQLNFNDPRSKLFFDFVRLLKECKPKYFLLENVKMKKEYEDVISKEVGVEPILINSALVSAQNRKRLYWTNIANVYQPEDKKIYLKDIIETGVVDMDKSFCIDASYFKGGNLVQYFEKHRRQLIFNGKLEQNQIDNDTFLGGNFKKFLKEKSVQYLITDKYTIDVGELLCNTRANSYRLSHIKGLNEKMRCLTANSQSIQNAGGCGIYKDGIYRILTPIECERAQTVPDNYTNGICKTQRYKMLGNGWTVDVIVHILKNMEFNEK